MRSLASIHVHPVKSMGGFAVPEARLTDRGLEHDRRWMLADERGRFLSQREDARLALFACAPHADGFRVTDRRDGGTLDLPWTIAEGPAHTATVWDDTVAVRCAPEAWSAWFRERLGRTVTLVHMPEDTHRPTDPRYADSLTSLSDAFPYLLLSQASLDRLNGQLGTPLPMDRFRPNLVIAGGEAFQEDGWREVRIGEALFRVVKPCARCAITTIDQRTGERGPEPLRTLALHRRSNGQVLFGQNAVALGGVRVRVGDAVVPVGA